MIFAAAASVVDLRIGGSSRPVGSADDVEALRERSDVNLLFILIDTLRAERLGAYGYHRDTSPLLDHVASNGVRFARHLAQSSWTKCSMASLWSGVYPQRSGITRFDEVIPDSANLPAEILRDAGFRTTALYRNGWVAPYFGFGQGFEVYTRPVSQPLPPSARRENPTLMEGGTDSDLLSASQEFLRIHGNERWFLYLHMMDIHEYIFDEDTALFGPTHPDAYDNAILRTNRVLDGLLGALAEAGHLDDTIVVFASDHGEAFSERGLEGHARFVYRETTEVPFILHFPFRFDPGVVIESRTQNVDVWPTLLDLLGLPPLDDTDGTSRVPEILAALRGEQPPPDTQTGFAHLDTTWGQRGRDPAPTIAVTKGRHRLVAVPARGEIPASEELFDGTVDAGELRNVASEQPEVADELREAIRAYLASSAAPWGEAADALEMDEIQLNQLRALGYEIP
jgi:arylsulfatase A-like enzyme